MFRRVIVRLAALNVAVLVVIVGLVLAAVFFGARYGLQKMSIGTLGSQHVRWRPPRSPG